MESSRILRKPILLLLFTYFSVAVLSQNIDKDEFIFDVDTIDVSSTEKIFNQKDFLIKCMDFYLSKSVGNISQQRMNCLYLFLKLNRVDDFRGDLMKYQPHKLIRGGNTAYAFIYHVGQTKLKLEYPEYIDNDLLLLSKSVELFLDYCFDKTNKVHISKERKRVYNLRQEGKLDLYISELIRERGERQYNKL